MWINWTKYTFGAFLLASLSLLLFGCGGTGSTPTTTQAAPVTKTITGIVSDTGLPLPGATVTAYAIDAAGVQAATPLSLNPESITSDQNGKFTLKIPNDFTGAVMLEATVPSAKLIDKAAKLVHLQTSGKKIRSAIPKIEMVPTTNAMISFATETVVKFIEENIKANSTAAGFTATGFSYDNIQKATIVMETFFGLNFTQIPPPKSELDIRNSTTSQQDLLVSIQALDMVATASNITISQIVTAIATTGLGDMSNTIMSAITSVVNSTLADILPTEYVPSTTIITAISEAANAPVTPPDLTDTTPPTAPADLAATAVNAKTVSLTWTAATDSDTGVAGYTVYRSDAAASSAAIATVGKDITTYIDFTAAPATQYSYTIVAFDGSRNPSEASNAATVTTPATSPADTVLPPSSSYTISGKITFNGTGLAGVIVSIAGTGAGSVATDASGNYSVPVLNGSYVITPSLAGYIFTPASKAVSVNSANVTGQDFTATTGSVTGGMTYPGGTVTGGTTYPGGTVTGGTTYPGGSVTGGVTYPGGSVTGGVTYPNGSLTATLSYPAP